jgi:hypothetical protein
MLKVKPEDFRLQKIIEAMLVRSYVDTRKIDVQVIGGNVYIDGTFEVANTGGVSRENDEGDVIESHHGARRTLLLIEQQIRSMGEVNGLYFKFRNWSKSVGGWMPVKMG